MPNAPVAAAATGLPETDYAAALLPIQGLEKLSNADLYHLAAALHSASDMFAYTPASRVLEGLNSVLIDALGEIRNLVEDRTPADADEANWRGWLLAAHAAFVSEPLSDMAVSVAQAAAVERDLSSNRH